MHGFEFVDRDSLASSRFAEESLPKVPSVANRSDPWWDAIHRGEGPVRPKVPSHDQGAWTNYKPVQENGSSGTNVSGGFAVPPIIEVPESPTLAFRAAPQPSSQYGNCFVAPKARRGASRCWASWWCIE